MNISLINETENDLIVSVPNIPEEIVILSGEKKDISCGENSTTFSVKKKYAELNNMQKLLSYLLGTVIGALLCLIYYSQIESLKNSVKFPVTFFVPKEKCDESAVIKLRDTFARELCSAQMNGISLKSEMTISKQALEKERKEYYASNITMFVVPYVTVFALSVIAAVYFKMTAVSLIAAAVNVLLFAPLLVIIIKNRIFYKRLYSEITTD